MVTDILKKKIAESLSFNDFSSALNNYDIIHVKGLYGALKSFVLLMIYEKTNSNIIYITSDDEEAEIIKNDLEIISDNNVVAYFADHKEKPYDFICVDYLNKSIYQDALEKIIVNNNGISIISANALCRKILSVADLKKQRLVINVNELYDFEIFKLCLTDLGFTREPVVENYGEMSIRGGIIDIFPFSKEHPIRVEFFGDNIESIREFDITTQRSIKSISNIVIYPQFPQNININDNAEFVSLLKYYNNDSIVVFDEEDRISQIINDDFEEAEKQYNIRIKKEKILEPNRLYQNWDNIQLNISNMKKIIFNSFIKKDEKYIDFKSSSQESFNGRFKLFKENFNSLLGSSKNGKPEVFFLCNSEDQIERMAEIMKDEKIDTSLINFFTPSLNAGFNYPQSNLHIYTDSQFYGRIRRSKKTKNLKKGLSFKQLQTLNIHDYIVHIDYGIGKFLGLKKISIGNNERECLYLEYKDSDKVYVPLEKMNRVQKYSDKDGVVPKINKLGRSEWERLKNKTKKRVKNIAKELIALYAKRKKQKGFSFKKDTVWQRELEASFVFDDTPDQIITTEKVKMDMEASNPMERLICGDVGYGKTEIAIRAAFKAANDSKQVAVLVPTTVLALQHFETFSERLKDFPVKVEMISRFRSKADQKKILEWLKNGKVDIIIGTHRLLSKDVLFKDLGLLVIDEEQRFGVTHKEKIKNIKANVDIISMTATPIPRTLNMSLLGVRDLSLINTAPHGRLPIHTEVIPFNNDIIRTAILKEVERGGQIFFVHNRVQSIYSMHNLLMRLVPEISFAVAHGQMDGKKLEKIMWDFESKKYHCLISTMIIESGLDIPNVNTLIINRADRFGLAQLYQLRGRVGRSNNRAYAYLIAPPIKNLTKVAIKRLRTIEEFTELGSGLQIAMRDLHIRGAGNILGSEQSGFIVSLGFDLYYKILDEAMQEIKIEKEGKAIVQSEQFAETKVDLPINAFLPKYFVEYPEERVNFYKRIAESTELNQILEIKNEIEDRFGKLPDEAKNLIYMSEFKIIGSKLYFKKISLNSKRLFLQFHPEILNDERELLQQRMVLIVDNANYPFTFVQGNDNIFGIKIVFSNDVNDKLKFTKNFLQNIL